MGIISDQMFVQNIQYLIDKKIISFPIDRRNRNMNKYSIITFIAIIIIITPFAYSGLNIHRSKSIRIQMEWFRRIFILCNVK